MGRKKFLCDEVDGLLSDLRRMVGNEALPTETNGFDPDKFQGVKRHFDGKPIGGPANKS